MGSIDQVCIILARLGADLNCAVDTLHHAPKAFGSAPGDANRARGASAFRDAARLLYTVTGMIEDERDLFGISEAERRSLIRLDSAKVNIAPPSIEARWFRIVGVPLGNATELYPRGDEVPTVEPWQPPDTWAGLSNLALNDVLSDIDAGMESGARFSGAASAKQRAAWKIVQRHCPDKSEGQCREIIKTWLKNGVLIEEEYDDPGQRKTVLGLRLDHTKRPS